ncbi:MAG: NYN domain-containing protein [Clostridia bacterium]|nr:NYN domain-containing protein [Clostridia bacterium]
MARNRRIALLIDVDNVKLSKESVEELFDQLNNGGEVVYCKFYGYNDRKHLYLNDFITNYGYETAPFMRLKKRFSQLDNRILVDAVRINYTKPDIDSFCIVAGDGDLIPLLVELKSCGKTTIDVNTEYQELNAHMFDEHVYLRTINRSAQTYTPKTKKTAAPKKAAASKAAPVKTTTKRVVKTAPVYEEVEEEYYEEPVPATRRVVRQAVPAQQVVYAQPVYQQPVYAQPAPAAPVAPAPQPTPAPAKEEEEDFDSYFDDEPVASAKPTNDNLDDYIEDEYYDEPAGEYDLSEALRDITSRYNQLDFTTNDNMSEKLKLIRDIENLIENENSKGEGIYSDNEDIRQIFSDLQDVVDDMKNAL